MVVDRLPNQQYTKILNSFGVNIHTKMVTQAVMPKRGEHAPMTTLIQKSAVISEHTPELGLAR